jgi:hypothetical protein
MQNKKNKKYEAISNYLLIQDLLLKYTSKIFYIFLVKKKGKFWLKVWGKNGTSLKAIFTIKEICKIF